MGEYDDLLGRGEYAKPSRDDLLAQVAALTAERDEWKADYRRERDTCRKAQAELAAANARIAELEDALDIVKRLNDEVGAERDDAKRRSLHAMNQRDEERRMKEGNIVALNNACAERDAARAELAAANARCAELEAELKDADLRGASGCTHFLRANNLQATLDRVTALADEWTDCAYAYNQSDPLHHTYKGLANRLRAALTPEGKPSCTRCGGKGWVPFHGGEIPCRTCDPATPEGKP